MPLRPCLDCGAPGRGTRCGRCTSTRDRDRNARRTHYHGDYRTRAKKVRDTATVCWICGGGASPSDPWQADHLDPGNPDSPLAAAHRSCNARRGNGR